MVDKAKKTTQARARIAHKLAKYVRANPVHIKGKLSSSSPSVSHLCTPSLIQHMEELQKENLEIIRTHGIQLTMRRSISKEKEISPISLLEENQFKQEMLSSSLPENIEEEESLSWRIWNQEIFLFLVLMPSMVSLSKESIQHMLWILQQKFLSTELMPTSTILSSKDKEDLLKMNWKMHHRQGTRKLKNQRKLKLLGEPKPKTSRNQSMKS